MADVTLRKVVKRYDDVEAVRGIDLDIADHGGLFATESCYPLVAPAVSPAM